MDFSAITSVGTFTTAVAALAAVEGTVATLYVAWVGGRVVLQAINGDYEAIDRANEQLAEKPEAMSSADFARRQGTFDEAADAAGLYDLMDED